MIFERFNFSEDEQKKIVESLVIIVDTREKKNEHILSYFEKHKIKYVKKALKCGDYSFYIEQNNELSIPRDIYFDDEIIIERKNSLEELSSNFTVSRTRFEEEFSTTLANNKYLLIENANYSDICDNNYDTKYNNKSFLGSIHSFNHKFGLQVVFIPDNKYTPIYILGTFKYYLKGLIK